MAIAPRIIRKGVTPVAAPKAAPVAQSAAADLAADLTETEAEESAPVVVAAEEAAAEPVVEEETPVAQAPVQVTPRVVARPVAAAPVAPKAVRPAVAVAPKPVVAKVAVAPAQTNVAAAIDKAAKEDSKKLSPLPKKVVINRGPKEEKPLEEGDQLTRDQFFRMFQQQLVSYEEMDFSQINLAQSRRFFEFLEKFVSDTIDMYRCNLFGFLFKHEQKKGSFREPKDIIYYNGPHKEISARKIFDGLTAAVYVNKDENGNILSFEAGRIENNQFIADKELSKIVIPEYMKHLRATAERLEADDAQAAARAAKIQERNNAAAALKL